MSDINQGVYLFFRGNCREAMEFYKSIFGGELTLQTRGEAGMPMDDGMSENSIMHAGLSGGDVELMASDTAQASLVSQKITLSLGGSNEERLHHIFELLSQDVEVLYPLKKEFWGDTFGSLTDKYGIEWMVNITPTKED